jgi:hypothetical protein
MEQRKKKAPLCSGQQFQLMGGLDSWRMGLGVGLTVWILITREMRLGLGGS